MWVYSRRQLLPECGYQPATAGRSRNMPDPLNVVIDISHHNGNVDLAKAKEDGILGVIQTATQGQTFKDPTYERNRQKAKDAGLLWGAYHWKRWPEASPTFP